MKIIGIGETVCDIIFKNDMPQRAVPGGSTFNSMISLGRTLGKEGVPCFMISAVGDDHVGKYVGKFMTDSHVSAAYLTQYEGCQSTISLAFLDENNDAQYEFYKDPKPQSMPLSMPEIEADDIVVFGSYFAVSKSTRELVRTLLQHAHDAGATIYYDINFRPNHLKELEELRENITDNYRHATIVRGSTDDFFNLYGTRDADLIYEKYLSQYCRHLICTDGGNAVTAICNGRKTIVPVVPIATVSTIGAGDNFNAGYIYGLAKGLNDPTALIAVAQQFASHVCQSLYNYVDTGFTPQL
ncbi:MAG: PfkB family carbohydrate kinase [Bacteroidales bacterium]|nr:PfkB family carbohydrate kinase [Bacteroidales bacterium]